MNEIINIIGKTVIDNGIWKFVLAWIFFAIVLVFSLFTKEKDAGHRLLILALVFMFSVISFFLLAGLLQLIL